jgi:hypothetical protein
MRTLRPTIQPNSASRCHEYPDAPHALLLRARRNGPRNRSAAKQREKLASP